MGLFNKLMFWKKDDLGSFDAGFGKDAGMDLGFGPAPGAGNNNFGMENDFGGQPFGQGMSDATNFKLAGNMQQSRDLNKSIYQQMGDEPVSSHNAYNAVPSDSGYSSYGRQSFQPQMQPQMAPPRGEIEILSAKLDAIKATMDAINQRLANLERVAYQDQEKKRYAW